MQYFVKFHYREKEAKLSYKGLCPPFYFQDISWFECHDRGNGCVYGYGTGMDKLVHLFSNYHEGDGKGDGEHE